MFGMDLCAALLVGYAHKSGGRTGRGFAEVIRRSFQRKSGKFSADRKPRKTRRRSLNKTGDVTCQDAQSGRRLDG